MEQNITSFGTFAGWKDDVFVTQIFGVNPAAVVTIRPVQMTNGSKTFNFTDITLINGQVLTATQEYESVRRILNNDTTVQ